MYVKENKITSVLQFFNANFYFGKSRGESGVEEGHEMKTKRLEEIRRGKSRGNGKLVE